MKVLPLVGPTSLKAAQACHTLLLGLTMLPMHRGTPYEEFFGAFKKKTDAQKETLIREAALFVPIEQDELEALLSFTSDKNGVPFSKVNLKNLGPKEMHEGIVAVCMEISRIEINLVTEEEKKNSESSAST